MRARAVDVVHGRAGQDAEKDGVVSSSDAPAQDEAKAKSASVTSRVMWGRRRTEWATEVHCDRSQQLLEPRQCVEEPSARAHLGHGSLTSRSRCSLRAGRSG